MQPQDPGATPEGVGAADPRLASIFEELPVPPQPLTLQERYAILEEAAERLDSKRKSEENVLHPFIGRQVPQRVINEFAVSRALLREFKPGHFVQARMRESWSQHEGTGFRPEKEGKRHLFVYRLVPEQTSQRPRTILSFLGLLELNQEASRVTQDLEAYKTTRVLVRALGPDSFVDHSQLLHFEVPNARRRLRGTKRSEP